MVNLVRLIYKHAESASSPRFRDRRAFYASQAMADRRDLYWELTGEKPTDPIDFLGKAKMMVGSGVEHQLVKEYIEQLHWYGVHSRGSQIPVGSSNPNIDGNLDGLLYEKKADGKFIPFVLEIKTKSGYGADMFYNQPVPTDEYMAQLGLYLKDLHEKKVTSRGCFLYVLLSDKHFGKLVQVDCHYDAESNSIFATKASYSDGEERQLDVQFNLQQVFDRLKELEKHVADKVPPKPDYQYKYPLSPEMLAEQSDYTLKAMLQGHKILGDWQPRYSKFLTKNIAFDNIERGYSDEEMQMIRKEYLTRHPKSKL